MSQIDGRDEVVRLRDRVAELEELVGTAEAVTDKYASLGLSKKARQCLGFVVKRSVAPRESMYAALYGSRLECDSPEIGVLNVWMSKVRKALRPHGIEIKKVHGVGWSMSAADKAKLALMTSAEGRHEAA